MSFLIPANETQLEYVKKENDYRSDAELEEDVTQLIEWLYKQPHLPNITDRKWLLHFIIACKFSLQRTKHIIEMYFIARAEHPELFSSFTRQELDNWVKFRGISFFPKLTPEGNRVCCSRNLPANDDDVFDAVQEFKTFIALMDLQLKEEPMYGNIFLTDMKNFRLSHFLTLKPTIVKNFLKCCIHSFPLRVKSAHFLNPPSFMGSFLMLFKMFLPNKLKQRIFVHNSLEELYQYIPKDILPDMYGGTSGNIEKFEEYWNELLKSNTQWLDARPKADLSKLSKYIESDEVNMNGTFKQLQID